MCDCACLDIDSRCLANLAKPRPSRPTRRFTLTRQDKKNAPLDWAALAAPFDPLELGWRVGHKSKDGSRVQLLAYVTSRAVMDRLDLVVGPARWGNDFRANPLGGLLCGIWVDTGTDKVWKWDGADATRSKW